MNSKTAIALASLALALVGCATNRPIELPAAGAIQITDPHMLNSHDGWAWSGGLAGQQLLLRTSDGGTTWRDVTPRGFPYDEEGACFRDARTAWVSFFNRSNATAGLLRTTDGGKSWSLLNQTNAPIFNEASSLRFFSSTYGVGNTADSGMGSSDVTFFETHDSGKTWSRIPFTPRYPGPTEYPNMFGLSNIAGDRLAFYPPASAIIAYGDMADERPKGFLRFSLTTDLGKNWHDHELPLPKQYQNCLCTPFEPVFLDRKNIVLAAHIFESTGNSYSTGSLVFYTSRDGGATWTAKPGVVDLDEHWYGGGLEAVSPECFFIASDSNIFVTHDGARSWKTLTPNISFGGNSKRDITRMKFVDAKHGWLVISDHSEFHRDGYFILYRTVDGGKFWTELPVRIVADAASQ